MTTDTSPRQLFTQASNPNAPTPVASPYGSPPSTGSPFGAYAHGAPPSGTQDYPQYPPTQFSPLPGPLASGTDIPAPHPSAAPPPVASAGGFVHPATPQIQESYSNEKAEYRAHPQHPPQPSSVPLSASPPAAVTNEQPPMAYHQIMQNTPAKERPQPTQSPSVTVPAPVVHQPTPSAPMGLSVNTSGKDGAYDANGEREWTHGLFDCCADAGTCALACCVPCLVYGKNKTRLDHLHRNGGVPHPEGGDMFGGDCFIHGLLTCLGVSWVLQITSRADVRRRYRIRGGGCGDCCTAFCCAPCELTQESLELAQEERSYQRSVQSPVLKM